MTLLQLKAHRHCTVQGNVQRARPLSRERIIEHRRRVDALALTARHPANTTPILEINGQILHVVRDNSRRRWVLCPLCENPCRHLYPDGQQLACRRCLKLEHRHQYRTIPAIHNIRRLRRKIDADPNPFAPIKRNPKARHRVQAIIHEIYAEEAKLPVYMRSFNDNLSHLVQPRAMLAVNKVQTNTTAWWWHD